MRTYGQVKDGILYYKFSTPQLPTLPGDTMVIDITDITPQPQEGWLWNGTAFEPPTQSLAEVKELTISVLNGAFNEVKMSFMTFGNDFTYIVKYEQAKAFAAVNYQGTPPSLVQAEADSTGATVAQAAETIIAAYNSCVAKLAYLEKQRRDMTQWVDDQSSVGTILTQREIYAATVQGYITNGIPV